MKKKLLGGLATGLMVLGMTGIVNAATINIYTDFTAWSSAVGSYNLEDFSDVNLLPGLSYTSTSGGYIDPAGFFWDQPTQTGSGTTWTFNQNVDALGGDWNLSGPGGPGMGLLLTMSDGTTTFFAPEISNHTNNFWGFTSDVSFTTAFIQGGTRPGAWAETHTLDNMVYNNSTPVPEPATMLLFGTGLAGLAAVGHRKKKA